MRCKKCGEEMPDKARFCPGCGAPVDDVPAPKKLEEPLDPLAAGAVPLVPVAPPPRATRLTPRIPRPYVPHSNQRTSRYSGARYVTTPSFVPHEREEAPSVEKGTEPVAEPEPRRESPFDRARKMVEREVERRCGAGAERVAKTAGERGVEPADEKSELVVQAEERREAHATPSNPPVPERAAAPEPPTPEALETFDLTFEPEPIFEEEPPGEAEPSAEATGHLEARGDSAHAKGPGSQGGASVGHGRSVRDRARHATNAVRGGFAALGPDRVPTVAIAAVIAVVVIGVLVYASMSWFGPFADRSAVAPQVEPPSDGSIAPIEQEEPAEEAPVEGGPEVQETLEAYSWQDLSSISALIAGAASDEDGIAVAAHYNLCDEDGTIDATNTKELELADGTSVPMAVADFRHDKKSDGSGVAGITFVARASLGNQVIEPTGTVVAWEDTPLRSWLNQSLMADLPPELADLVVAVDKTTNLPPSSGAIEQGVTSETLWLLSYSEVVGPIGAENRRYGIYQSEGEQYRIYEEAGVTSTGASPFLALDTGEYWWLRSPDVVTPGEGEAPRWYLCVGPDGSTPNGHRTGTSDAIVVGFCL